MNNHNIKKSNSSQIGLLESALEILRQAVSGKPFTNQAQLARASGESEANISRWLSGASTPTLRRLEPVLMTLGVRFTLPGERAAALVHKRTDTLDRRPDSWKIVNSPSPLPPQIYLEVRPDDHSMQPTLCPGDVVVVDTSRSTPLHHGQIYLVRQPDDPQGPCMFRRLSLQMNIRHGIIVLNPDNLAGGYEPLIRHMHSAELPANFIIGRAVKRITDMAK